MPAISVIVPVYKVEQFLDRCVKSILNQSFRDFTLILVDDGSPDRCGEMCDGYALTDSRIHVIHRENGGLSAARNSAIDWTVEKSESQWITFVDSDDWLHRDYLKHLYEAVQESGCLIAACEFCRTHGETLEPAAGYRCEVYCADDYYCGSETASSPVACAKLYHKSLFEGLRFPVGKLHEDEFTTFRTVYKAGRTAVVPMALYAYYQNPEGIIHSSWNPRKLHILEAFEQQMEYARQEKKERLFRKAVNHYIYSIHEQLAAAEKPYHAQLRSKYRKALKLGRECGIFPLCWENLWAYEEAYPAKLVWWPLFQGKRLLDRFLRKE